MREIQNYTNILPLNIQDERVVAVDKTISQTIEELKKTDFNLLPQNAKKEYLQHLAYMFSLDISGLSVVQARKYIAKALLVNRYKGTIWAVKEVLKSLNIETRLIEVADDLKPYHFKVVVMPQSVDYVFDEVGFKKIVKLLDSAKNVRSVLDGFIFEIEFNQNVNLFGAGVSSIAIQKDCEVDFKVASDFNVAGAGVSSIKIEKDCEVDFKVASDFNLTGASATNIEIKKDCDLSFILEAPADISSAFNLNLNLKQECRYEMKNKNKTNLQGAIIWQV